MTDGSYLSINPEPIKGPHLQSDVDAEPVDWERIVFSVEGSIDIARPREVVFRIMDDMEDAPDVVEHTDIVPFAAGGHSCTKVFRRGSELTTQRNAMVEYVPGERVVVRTSSPAGRAIQTCSLEALSSGTRLSLRVEAVRGQHRFWATRWIKSILRRQIADHLARVKVAAEALP